jgi:hypothetical protein
MGNNDLRAELMKIRKKKGALTPAIVVDAARNKKSPLHDQFEWDDTVAAEKYRRDQAHRLIQKCKVTYIDSKGRSRDVRAFLAVRGTEVPQPVYDPVEEIAADPLALKIALAQAEREWRTLRARWSHLTEFTAMIRQSLDDDEATG